MKVKDCCFGCLFLLKFSTFCYLSSLNVSNSFKAMIDPWQPTNLETFCLIAPHFVSKFFVGLSTPVGGQFLL
jgi:hypothetical protein